MRGNIVLVVQDKDDARCQMQKRFDKIKNELLHKELEGESRWGAR